jgi:hypothetical protein
MNPPNIAELVQKISASIESIVGDGQLTTINIFTLCISAMQLVEAVPKLTGVEKKMIVIQTLTEFASRKGADPSLLQLIPTFIDTIISVENGITTISPKVEEAVSSCLPCLPCLRK